MRIAAELGARGFAVRAIRPPTVAEGTARLRLSLTCNLRDDEIAKLVRAMAGAREMCWDAERQRWRVSIEIILWRKDILLPERIRELERRCFPHCCARRWTLRTGSRYKLGLKWIRIAALFEHSAGLEAEKILPEAYQFAPPVSPHLAARRAGVRIDLTKIILPAE